MQAPIHSCHADNPRDRVQEVFARIARTRMADIPINNQSLEVSVPAMRAWNRDWIGVLVTPWTINLIVLPGRGGVFEALEFGACQHWSFPSGDYEFLGLHEEGLGFYQSCSLMSPVMEFVDQDAAEMFALSALQALLEPAPEGLNSNGKVHQVMQPFEAQTSEGVHPEGLEPVSRRGFLFGRRR